MAPGRAPRVAGLAVAIAVVLLLTGVGAGAGGLIHTHSVDRPTNLGDFVLPSLKSQSPQPVPQPTHLAQPPHVQTSHARLPTGLLFVLLVVAASLLVLGLLWYAITTQARRSGRTMPPESDADGHAERDQLLMHAADAQAWLEGQLDPRKAVIGCWLRLEAMAARAGVPRSDSETAGELTVRVLGEWPIDPIPLQQLRARFEVARFSVAFIEPEDLATARSALAAVIDGLQSTQSSGVMAALGAPSEASAEGTT